MSLTFPTFDNLWNFATFEQQLHETDQEEAFAGPAAGKGKVGEGGGGLTPTLAGEQV